MRRLIKQRCITPRCQRSAMTDGDSGADKTRRECAKKRSLHRVGEHFEHIPNEVWDRQNRRQPHLESPQERQVIHPSIMINATVLHLLHS